MALEISQATSKQSKATWRIYGKLMQSCKLRDKIQSKWLKIPFPRCFDLKLFKIRGVTLVNFQRQPPISLATPKPIG
jgi:hypothetical protein